jgi:anthranilate synthase component 2
MKVLLIDNLDSFTYMLKDYIEQCGADCEVIRSTEPLHLFSTHTYDAVVISPGPGTPTQSGHLMALLPEFIYNKPVLGICLGHQAIGEFFGANLQSAILPRHGKVDEITCTNDPVFEGMNHTFNATRYHSLILKDVRSPLLITAFSTQDEVMGIRHETLPVWGIQFHPESCQTENGIRIMKNYLALAMNKC